MRTQPGPMSCRADEGCGALLRLLIAACFRSRYNTDCRLKRLEAFQDMRGAKSHYRTVLGALSERQDAEMKKADLTTRKRGEVTREYGHVTRVRGESTREAPP